MCQLEADTDTWMTLLGAELLALQRSQVLCDVTIETACGGQIQVHSIILAAGSSMLRNMMVTQTNSGYKLAAVSINSEFTMEVLKPLITFLYTGKLDVPRSQAGQLHRLANMLKIQRLVDMLRDSSDTDDLPEHKSVEPTVTKRGRKEDKVYPANDLEDLEHFLFMDCPDKDLKQSQDVKKVKATLDGKVRKEEESVYRCTLCGLVFQSFQSLFIHSDLCQNLELGGEEEDDISPVDHLPDLHTILGENVSRSIELSEENVKETMNLSVPGSKLTNSTKQSNLDQEHLDEETEDVEDEIQEKNEGQKGEGHFENQRECQGHNFNVQGDVEEDTVKSEASQFSSDDGEKHLEDVREMCNDPASPQTSVVDINKLRTQISQMTNNDQHKGSNAGIKLTPDKLSCPQEEGKANVEADSDVKTFEGKAAEAADDASTIKVSFKKVGRIISSDEILKQLTERESSKPVAFCCDICGVGLTNREAWKVHMSSHSDNKPQFKCSVCLKTFHAKSYLRRHVRQVHSNTVKTHVCDVCDKVFKVKSHLNTHMKFDHCKDTDSQDLNPCHICDKTFRYPVLLRQHLKTHTNELQFLCELCDKGFTTRAFLDRHLLTHVDIQPWKCTQCDKSFKYKSSLKHHLETTCVKASKPEDVHQCELCTKCFSEKKNLTAHVKQVHLGVKQYTCSVCQRSFARNSTLKNHIDSIHNKAEGKTEGKPIVATTVCMMQDKQVKKKLSKKRHKTRNPESEKLIPEPVQIIVDKFVKIQPKVEDDSSYQAAVEEAEEKQTIGLLPDSAYYPGLATTQAGGLSVTNTLVSTAPALHLTSNPETTSVDFDPVHITQIANHDSSVAQALSTDTFPVDTQNTVPVANDNQQPVHSATRLPEVSRFNPVSLTHITHTQPIFVKSLSSSSVVITNAGPPTKDFDEEENEERSELYFVDQSIDNQSTDLSLLHAAEIGSDDSYVKNKLDYSLFNLSTFGKTPDRF